MSKFEPGHAGGPGRPRGARSKLSETFLKDLQEKWDESGKAVITNAMEKDPIRFLQVIADLLPKEATLNVNETLTIKSAAVLAVDGWIESLAGNRVQGDCQDISEDRPLLPAPVSAKPH